MKLNLMQHQIEALNAVENYKRCAFYYDCGLGKTFMGAEKAIALGNNILVICQKSKIADWIEHFFKYYIDKMKYDESGAWCYDLTSNTGMDMFLHSRYKIRIGVINYDLTFRRPQLAQLTDFTLLLDESSLIQNETAKRSKFILNKLNPENVILLSGTPVSGKYELLWSQCYLLGWKISKELFYRQYVEYGLSRDGYPIITGYKNVERLKRKLREYGAVFKKTEEVLTLPEQMFIDIKVPESKEYKIFKKDRIITIGCETLVGDTTLTNLLYQRQLCGIYSEAKMEALRDLLESTSERLIIFYNFTAEMENIRALCAELGKPVSIVNGAFKDFTAYENNSDSVTLVQYQAGAYGLNLQKSQRIVYYTPPLSTELFEQSKKRIHRIGQKQTCFYYQLKCGIEYQIYDTLALKKDYTDELFKEEENEI